MFKTFVSKVWYTRYCRRAITDLGVLEARVHVQPVMADGVGPVCRAAAAEKESEHRRKKKERKTVERTMYYVLVSRGPPNPYDTAKRKSPTRSFYSLENPTKRNLSAAALVLLPLWYYPILNTRTGSQNVQFIIFLWNFMDVKQI